MTVDTHATLTPAPLRNIAEFPLSSGKLIIALEGHAPPWAEPTLQRFGEFLRLPPGWDSYKARAIDPGCVWSAFELLRQVLPDDAPPPAVVPTPREGVQIEWHINGVDLEIHVDAPGRYHVTLEDQTKRQEWETEIGENLSALTAAVARLMRR